MAKDRHDTATDDFLLRMDLNNPEIDWSPPTELPDLRRCGTVAVDLESRDPDLTKLGPGWAAGNGEVVGIAVAGGDFAGYFPIRHASGGNLDPKMVLRWFGDLMGQEHSTKIMHNALYDRGWLRREGVEVKGKVLDTMIAAPLIDENRMTYRLDALGRDYCGIRKDEKDLRRGAAEWGVDPKAEMWKLPSRYVGAYATQDAVLTLQLWERLKIELEQQDLWSIFELETDLQEVLLEMRWRGIRVDEDAAAQAKRLLEGEIAQIHADLKGELGFSVDHWSATSCAKAFTHYGLRYPTTEAGAPSFTKPFLQLCDHDVARKIMMLREADKAGGTFVDGLMKHVHNGRIHCEYHQLPSDDGGAVTGRLASSNPNLQNLPARVERVKKLIRGMFLPEPGEQFGSFDYSSQEPRLLVHFAASLPERLRHPMVDEIVGSFHRGEADLHQMVADMVGITRKKAKAINLGIMYGMGAKKMAAELGVSFDEAKAILALHDDRVPFVKKVAQLATDRALSHGQVRTILGRVCRFHLWEPTGYGYNKPLPFDEAQKVYGGVGGKTLRRAFSYKALNKVIQGSAADQNKRAMVDCYREGLLPLLTVHDELCFSISSKEQVERITEIMVEGVKLLVPNEVDVALADNWGDID